jgi:hypothetical protein
MAVNVTSSTYKYLNELLFLALEGASGQIRLSPELSPLVKAFHHVLAGGKLKADLVEQEGNREEVRKLERALQDSIAEANDLNRQLGRRVGRDAMT